MVEDDTRLAQLLERELSSGAGYDVTAVFDGGSALARLETESDLPDLVVLDLNLPDMDGLDVAKRLRQDSEVRILMLTARGDLQSRVDGLIRRGE